MITGRIIKGVGGLYTVFADNKLYSCRAKGIFRKQGVKPLTGDDVSIEIIDDINREALICEIKPRRNRLIRPELANIDNALIVCALNNPKPNFVMLDKLILSFKQQDIHVIIAFNKADLADKMFIEECLDMYKDSGAQCVVTNALEKSGTDSLKKLLYGKLTAVAGMSGVGKSSIINALQSMTRLETGQISVKLKRGRHTTRHSEIIPIDDNTFITDTPGFSSLELFNMAPEDLAGFYDEFMDFTDCFYKPCSHTHEPGCAVKEAVNNLIINNRRYENYVHIYNELKRCRNT